jgi:hypothetical protein
VIYYSNRTELNCQGKIWRDFFENKNSAKFSGTMSDVKVKILFVGPCNSGKSRIVNVLSENDGGGTAIPTTGVRILEYPRR